MASTAIKKISVKLRKRETAPPQDYFVSTWETVKAFIQAVHNLRFSGHSFEELYSIVSNVVTLGQGGVLYAALKAECSAHIARVVASLDKPAQSSWAHLALVHECWTNHCTQMALLRAVFLYLDTAYVRSVQDAQPLWDMGLALFREHLLETGDAAGRVVRSFVDCVGLDRGGQAVDRGALASVQRMCGLLRVYTSHLEPAILAASATFFEAEGVALMAAGDIPGYLRRVEAWLRAERERAHAYLDFATLRPLLVILDSKLISAHATEAVDRSFAPLLQQARAEDLRRMFSLFLRVNRVEDMRRAFADCCKRCALEIVGSDATADEERDKGLVQSLLDFKDSMETMVNGAFDCHEAFATALKSALESSINSRENKPAELIAKFVDTLMRRGVRGLAVSGAAATTASAPAVGGSGGGGDDEVEAVLDKTMALFRCIHGKDVFEAFYKKDLAKRLLLGKSANNDLEKSMVARFKTMCGWQFTAKLEGMFKDMDLTAELQRQFDTFWASDTAGAGGGGAADADGTPAVGLDVAVLTSSYWPTYPKTTMTLPPSLAPSLALFEKFYSSKYTANRRLQWQHNLCHCLVKAQFPSGRKELDVSLYQAAVLLLFNGADSLGFLELKERAGIEDAELRRTLQSLALGQVRVLRKEPKGKDVLDGDAFHFNAEFKAQLVRLKINSIQLKETRAEVDATHEKVVQDRVYQLDATLVRIMKARKTLTHPQLVAEALAQLRFPAKPADVKARIHSLIERDYIERDEADSNTYLYVA